MKFTTFTTSTAKQKHLYTGVEYSDKQVFLFFGKYNGNNQPYEEWLEERLKTVKSVLSKYTDNVEWIGDSDKKNSDVYKQCVSACKLDDIVNIENGMVKVWHKWVNPESLSLSNLYYISASTNKDYQNYKYSIESTLKKVIENNPAIKHSVELANKLNSQHVKMRDGIEDYEAVVGVADKHSGNRKLTTFISTKDSSILHHSGKPLGLEEGSVVRFQAKHLMFRVDNDLSVYAQVQILAPTIEVIPKEASIYLSLK